MNFLCWATIRRRAADARLEVSCRRGHWAWLSPKELTWTVCPACVGWWVL